MMMHWNAQKHIFLSQRIKKGFEVTTKPQADYKELRDSRDSTLLIFCVVAFAKIEVLKIEIG